MLTKEEKRFVGRKEKIKNEFDSFLYDFCRAYAYNNMISPSDISDRVLDLCYAIYGEEGYDIFNKKLNYWKSRAFEHRLNMLEYEMKHKDEERKE